MLIKIDDFGRVLIPKVIRDHLGLTPGTTISLEEKGVEKLIMRVVHEKPALEVSEGVLVFNGTAQTDIKEAIQDLREERLRKLSGE